MTHAPRLSRLDTDYLFVCGVGGTGSSPDPDWECHAWKLNGDGRLAWHRKLADGLPLGVESGPSDWVVCLKEPKESGLDVSLVRANVDGKSLTREPLCSTGDFIPMGFLTSGSLSLIYGRTWRDGAKAGGER